jgi:hypothetical protein
MSTANSPFKVRLPIELREKLDAAAVSNNRSVTAEIIHRLERTFVDEGVLPDHMDVSQVMTDKHTQALFIADAVLYDMLSMKGDLSRQETERLEEIRRKWKGIPRFDPAE